jgi:hypothetical protein
VCCSGNLGYAANQPPMKTPIVKGIMLRMPRIPTPSVLFSGGYSPSKIACPTRRMTPPIDSGTRDTIWEWYDRNVVAANFGRNLHRFLNLDHPIAMMCMECDPTECHRQSSALLPPRRSLPRHGRRFSALSHRAERIPATSTGPHALEWRKSDPNDARRSTPPLL